jgi:hypothetical protein
VVVVLVVDLNIPDYGRTKFVRKFKEIKILFSNHPVLIEESHSTETGGSSVVVVRSVSTRTIGLHLFGVMFFFYQFLFLSRFFFLFGSPVD